MQMYRQGDVLIVSEDAFSEREPIPRDQGRIVLAYGEVTGHAHAIFEPEVNFVRSATGERILISPIPFTVRHEEHGTLNIPAGIYRVVQQREYTPESVRPVAD
jgi:hypothetical protein